MFFRKIGKNQCRIIISYEMLKRMFFFVKSHPLETVFLKEKILQKIIVTACGMKF